MALDPRTPAYHRNPEGRMNDFLRRWRWGCAALGLAAAIWLPSVHFFFNRTLLEPPDTVGVTRQTRELAARQLDLWTNPQSRDREVSRMRKSCEEWDFMGRSFLVWSLGELALRDENRRSQCLAVMDQIIDETLATEAREGVYFFLLPYGRAKPFVQQPARSQFLDGEIALMLAVRRLVEEKPSYKPLLRERVLLMEERMRRSPVLSAESYPDECWTFCNTIALAAMKLADRLEGTDHSQLARDWVKVAREKLVDRTTGLLVSSYRLDGTHKDGPEGSSIWMAAHCLKLVDEEFATDQYRRARREIGRTMFGFGYAREWPASWQAPMDVDSGPIVPIVGASAGSSGLALVGASSFGDLDFLDSLRTTLEFAAFPVRGQGRLKYCASNQLGDAVMLYANVLGPLWKQAKEGTR
jgi:hypothetical protein